MWTVHVLLPLRRWKRKQKETHAVTATAGKTAMVRLARQYRACASPSPVAMIDPRPKDTSQALRGPPHALRWRQAALAGVGAVLLVLGSGHPAASGYLCSWADADASRKPSQWTLLLAHDASGPAAATRSLSLTVTRAEVSNMSCPMALESRTRPAGTLSVPARPHCSIWLQCSVCVSRYPRDLLPGQCLRPACPLVQAPPPLWASQRLANNLDPGLWARGDRCKYGEGKVSVHSGARSLMSPVSYPVSSFSPRRSARLSRLPGPDCA